jgi:hypothetical protein
MPRVFTEKVNEYVDAIDQDPRRPVEARFVQGAEILGLRQLDDVIGDAAHLARAGAGGDDEEIADGREPPDVEDEDVVAACVGGETRGFDGECSGGGKTLFGFGSDGGLLCRDSTPPRLKSEARISKSETNS